MSKMKYKVGQEVFVKTHIIEKGKQHAEYKVGNWHAEKNVYSTKNTAPVVWRDGAVERPDDSCDIHWYDPTDEQDPMRIYFERAETIVDEDWSGCYWLPADEFPMPAMPEPTIEPCLFCGQPCETESAGFGDMCLTRWYVRCSTEDCNYMSRAFDSDQEAIEAHNKLAGKVKDE